MRDIDLFSKLLGLERPWKVTRVSLAPEEKHLDVWLGHSRSATFCCPECGMSSPLYDHIPLRRWRHLDHGGFLTWLNARVPRVACREHGIRQIPILWALPSSRFTIPFERHAIDVLLEADVLGGARLLHISWDEAWNLMERAVERGLRAKKQRVIAHLGVDEKAVARRHQYVTLVCDLDRSTVEYIADDRKKTSLDAYYQSLSKEQLAGIEAVAMDMAHSKSSATQHRKKIPCNNLLSSAMCCSFRWLNCCSSSFVLAWCPLSSWCLRWFHTFSSGFQSGEYFGKWNTCSLR